MDIIPLLYDLFLGHSCKVDKTQSVHAATRRTLLKIKGFSEVKVEKVKEAIVKLQVSSNAGTGTEIELTCAAISHWFCHSYGAWTSA